LKSKKKRKPAFSKEYLEKIKVAFMQVKPQELTKETVLKVAQQLVKMKFNPGAVIKVVKQQTGLGFSVKQVTATKEKKAPAPVEKTVERKVAAEIAKEAVAKIDAVLETGKILKMLWDLSQDPTGMKQPHSLF